MLPWVVRNYKLEELTTVRQLRENVAKLFRKQAHVTNPQVVDILVYKGREELEMVVLQHKQRHHLVDAYIRRPDAEAEQARRQLPFSPFMERFLNNSYLG